jgi:hypothetical protein
MWGRWHRAACMTQGARDDGCQPVEPNKRRSNSCTGSGETKRKNHHNRRRGMLGPFLGLSANGEKIVLVCTVNAEAIGRAPQTKTMVFLKQGTLLDAIDLAMDSRPSLACGGSI